jgi:hypothetical protein
MSVWGKFLGLFVKKKVEPQEEPIPTEEDIMLMNEIEVRTKMESLMKTIQAAKAGGDGILSNKQIIDLIVAIDPIIADLKKTLESIDPEQDTQAIEEARSVCDENAYLKDVLLSKVKDFH